MGRRLPAGRSLTGSANVPVVVFDIDGTLTDTTSVDAECYERALQMELGLPLPTDWEDLDEVTDTAILEVACRRASRSHPSEAELEAASARVAKLLEREFRNSPDRFRPVPGAPEVFTALTTAGWSVAIATGAWRDSAMVKLHRAGIAHDGLPLVTSSDVSQRTRILRRAARQAGAVGGPVVYIGDGVWDGRAARRLGYSFIGRGSDEDRARLERAGAIEVIPHFDDQQTLISTLERLRP